MEAKKEATPGNAQTELSSLAQETEKVVTIRLREVERRTGLKGPNIYQLMRKKKFPLQVQLGDHSVGWIESEIDEWLAIRINQRKRSCKPYLIHTSR